MESTMDCLKGFACFKQEILGPMRRKARILLPDDLVAGTDDRRRQLQKHVDYSKGNTSTKK